MMQTSPQPDNLHGFSEKQPALRSDVSTALAGNPDSVSTGHSVSGHHSEPYPIPSAPSDKLNHLLAFIQLAIVTRLAWPELSRIWIALGVMGFGLAIEVTQAQLPYRDFSLMDLAADGVGTAIGLLPCAFLFGRKNA